MKDLSDGKTVCNGGESFDLDGRSGLEGRTKGLKDIRVRKMNEEVSEGRRNQTAHVEGSTPMTSTSGCISLIAIATPAIRPPPPTGTRTASTSGHCSRISSPIDPFCDSLVSLLGG